MAPVSAQALTFTFIVSTAVASTTASTVAISATNTGMNTSGSFLHQAGRISSQAWKDTTSDQALKNMAIAAITAGTIQGISMGLNAMNSANAANAANGAATTNNATSLQLPPGTNMQLTFTAPSINPSQVSTFASNVNNLAITDRVINAIRGSLIQTVASSAAQSAVNGDSFADAIKNSTKNLLINAVGQIAANEIGYLAKTDQIDTTTQLTLHAGLGCAMAEAGGNNCAAGAAAGVVGELVSQSLHNSGLTIKQIPEVAKIAGAVSAAAVSGPDDGGSVFAGGMIGYNASANNDLAFQLEKGNRSRFGHLVGYVQKEDGSWIRYSQGIPENTDVSEAMTFLNFGYPQSIVLTIPPNEISQYLRDRDDVVYIETIEEQDKAILNGIANSIDNMDNTPYRLWTNNCVTSLVGACSGAGISLPNNSRPDWFFENLKEQYPNNYTNRAY